jgi:hypothetical protein
MKEIKLERKFTIEPEDFYGDSIVDIPMVYYRWTWNWKFPFLHRKYISLTLPQSKAEMNELMSGFLDYLNNQSKK